jgi:hypothetical protein
MSPILATTGCVGEYPDLISLLPDCILTPSFRSSSPPPNASKSSLAAGEPLSLRAAPAPRIQHLRPPTAGEEEGSWGREGARQPHHRLPQGAGPTFPRAGWHTATSPVGDERTTASSVKR